MSKPRILFLRPTNSARRQMAEAFLNKYVGDKFEAYSAGLEPKAIQSTMGQVLSPFMMAGGISLWVYLKRRGGNSQ